MFRYLARMTGRRDLADDLAQEVFLHAVRALHNGNGHVGHERGWIFSIARNLLVDRQRREQRRVVVVDSDAEPSHSPGQDLAVGLSQSLARLADADREVFLLKEMGGLSYDEIARVCDCTADAVRARLYRARTALRSMLSLSAD